MNIKKFNEYDKINESNKDLLPPFSGLSPYELKEVHTAFQTIFNVCIQHDMDINGLIKVDEIIDKIKEDINNYIDANEDYIINDIDDEYIFNGGDNKENNIQRDFEDYDE